MKIVTDGNYCVKCHSLGDYQVQGAVENLRPEFGPGVPPAAARLRAALDRQPAAHLAVHRHAGEHTVRSATPPNFGGVNQALFPGPSIMQLEASWIC